MVNIRQAIKEDFPKITALLKEFQSEILEDYGIDLNDPNMIEAMTEYVGSSFVAEEDGQIVGIIAGKFVEFPLNKDKIYQEAVWFVKRNRRKYGLKLMNHLTAWCKEQGVKFIVTSRIMNFKPESFDALYKRIGFVPYEVNYIKNLSGGIANV